MTRKTKQAESGNINFSTSGETNETNQTTETNQPNPEKPTENQDASREPQSTTPETGPAVPTIQNPRRKRGPYKPRQPKAEKPETVTVTLNRDAFASLAVIYGTVLQAAKLPPPLSKDEKDAITDAAHAVAQKYAADFEHWELAALAAALVAPIAVRMIAKYQSEGAEDAPKQHVNVVQPPASPDFRDAEIPAGIFSSKPVGAI